MSATAWMDDEVKRSKESFGLTIIFIWLKKSSHKAYVFQDRRLAVIFFLLFIEG